MGRTSEHVKKIGRIALRNGVEDFLRAHGRDGYDRALTPKIGRFILALTSTAPDVPLAGKKLRDLSAKQRVLFQAQRYEGTQDREFLGHWVGPNRQYGKFFFVFSRKTVSVSNTENLDQTGVVHKMVASLCHERPDPVVDYDRLAMAVPRFVKDMKGSMRYLSVTKNHGFENADKPGTVSRLWIRTEPINVLLSILDHQDVHVHIGLDFIAIYTRWFGAYFEGE